MVVTISPTKPPSNLDRVEFVLKRLETLVYLGPFVDIWFAYKEISPEIQRRYDSAEILGRSRFDPLALGEEYREIFSGTPKESAKLLTLPYPVQVDLNFSPQTWNDGQEIDKQCRLTTMFDICYWIKLDGETNMYYLAREPESKRELRLFNGKVDLIPASGFDENGIPLPCSDHYPFVEIYTPRFKEIRKIFEDAGLQSRIQGLPLELSEILKEKGL